MAIIDELNYRKNVVEPARIEEELAADNQEEVATMAADGTIGVNYGVVKITKGSAAALVLPAPGADDDGRKLMIVSDSAFAHVVTATNLIEDGVTGGPKDTATFAAFKGASITLLALNLKWYVLANNLVTVAAV